MHLSRMLVSMLACLAAVTVSSASDTPTWISLDGRSAEKTPTVTATQSNSVSTVIELELTGFSVEQLNDGGETFDVLRVPQYYTTLEIGLPQLPAITELIAIPGTTNATVRVASSTMVTLEDYKVYPFQTPLVDGVTRNTFDMDRERYAEDAFYPAEIVELGRPAIWRDLRVVKLRVYPFQHNPATGELRVYKKLRLILEYSGTSRVNPLARPPKPIAAQHDQMYRTHVLNYDHLDLQQQVTEAEDASPEQTQYDLLIIAVDRFLDEIDPLVLHKEPLIRTVVKPLSEIVPRTAEEIKDYIFFEYWQHQISWVLLVGDIAELPSYHGYTHPNTSQGQIVSDFWYALLEGNDLTPEVAVGRFSSMLESEITNMVDKTIAYPVDYSGDWTRDILLVSHMEDAPGKYQGCSEHIRKATKTLTGAYRSMWPDFSVAYGAAAADGGTDATNADVISEIDGGRIVVNYRGHGSVTSWSSWNTAGQSFRSTVEVPNLANGNRTPVVFGIACSNNALDHGSPCLGEAFTQPVDAAVAYLGASRTSYTAANHTYDQFLFSLIYDGIFRKIGNASNSAAILTMLYHEEWGEANAKMYLWLGDPSLEVPVHVDHVLKWLFLIDTSGSMTGERWAESKDYTKDYISRILEDVNDEVALGKFQGTGSYTLVRDWTRNEQDLKDAVDGLTTGGLTPLATAVCDGAHKLINDESQSWKRRLIVVTDGGENSSGGQCAGPSDSGDNPPWCDNTQSWHCKVRTKLLENVAMSIGYFGNLDSASFTNGDAPEEEQWVEEFLTDMADETWGTYFDPTTVCGNGTLDLGEQCEFLSDCNATDSGELTVISCTDCLCVLALVFPVPDGRENTTPMIGSRAAADGSTIAVDWDATSCPATNYNLLYGSLPNVSSYTLDGSVCALGTTGSFMWNGVPPGDLWFVIVGTDTVGTESSWGTDSDSVQRHFDMPSNECGCTANDTTATCP